MEVKIGPILFTTLVVVYIAWIGIAVLPNIYSPAVCHFKISASGSPRAMLEGNYNLTIPQNSVIPGLFDNRHTLVSQDLRITKVNASVENANVVFEGDIFCRDLEHLNLSNFRRN